MIDLEKTKTELEVKLRDLMARAEDIDDDFRQPGPAAETMSPYMEQGAGHRLV